MWLISKENSSVGTPSLIAGVGHHASGRRPTSHGGAGPHHDQVGRLQPREAVRRGRCTRWPNRDGVTLRPYRRWRWSRPSPSSSCSGVIGVHHRRWPRRRPGSRPCPATSDTSSGRLYELGDLTRPPTPGLRSSASSSMILASTRSFRWRGCWPAGRRTRRVAEWSRARPRRRSSS